MIRTLLSQQEAQDLGIAPDSNGRFYQDSYQGCVFGTYSRSLGFGDFIQYAVVWNVASQKITSVCFDYNAGGGCSDNLVDVDITPEYRADALAAELPKIVAEVEDGLEGDFSAEAHEVWGGKRVKVVKGRKFPIGAEGTVKWSGETRFGFSTLVAWDDGSEGWLSTNNLEVSNPPEYVRDQAAIDREVAKRAEYFWCRYRSN